MNIEAGKYYRTRDGRKALVLGKNRFASTYPWVVVVQGCGIVTVDDYGRASPFGNDSTIDLVEPWVETETRTAVAVMYSRPGFQGTQLAIFNDRIEATAWCAVWGYELLDCQEVTLTEGRSQ